MSDAPIGAGWVFVSMASRKRHWFPAGIYRSLCGRYMRFAGDRGQPDTGPSSDDCAPCRRKLGTSDAAV